MMMNLPCLRGSCPNFLRPIYHTLSACQAPRRGRAPRKKPMPHIQLLFLCLIVTDPHSPVVVLIYSVDAIPLWLTVGLLQMQSVPDSIIYGFLFQNPVQSPMPPIGHSTEFWSVLLVYLCFLCCHRCCASTGRLISFNCFCGSYVVPVFRIVWITLSILQAITISDCIFFNGLLGRVVVILM